MTETKTTPSAGEQPPGAPLDALGRLASRIATLETTLRNDNIPQAEKVHDARVTLKRFCAYWRAIDSKPSRKQLKHLRSASRALAVQREQDVLLETLAGLHHDISSDWLVACHIALNRFYESLEDPTTLVATSLDSALAALRKAWDAATNLPQPCLSVENRLPVLFKNCRKAMQRCRDTHKRNAWHTLRCRLKDFQYALELVFEPIPGSLGPLHKNIKRLASVLGDANDLRFLRKRIARLESLLKNEPVKAVHRACKKKTKTLMSEAHALCDGCLDKEYKQWKQIVRSCIENHAV